MNNKSIFVTQPFLPDLHEFIPYLEEIWAKKVLTNCGPFHQELENALCEYLGINYISLFSNGTLGLITALQALRITGEVITTPYSFVATSHSLLWHGNVPVFVDVDPVTLNLNPNNIEAAVTPNTTAIMPVHCYGNPCEIEAIQFIADKYNLRVIYDAAHAFGVNTSAGSILNHGDLSVLSFHATKVFNTFEGGAIVCNDLETKKRIDHLKNFGFVDELTVVEPGINAKMSEFNAAIGLLQLKYVDQAIEQRSEIDNRYRSLLSNHSSIRCIPQLAIKCNYSYFPVLITNEHKRSRDDVYQNLKSIGINARRYFYPLISEFPMYQILPSASRKNLPNAYAAAEQILCLPIYPGLSERDQIRIVECVLC